MRKGQRVSSSSESEENQQPHLKDPNDQSSMYGCSSEEDDSMSGSVEVQHAMKRSQGFNRSFSFGEDVQSPKFSNGIPVADAVEEELSGEYVQQEKLDTLNQPPRLCLFRPRQLWLAVTRCLSLRWPPCLSINRQSNMKLAYHVETDQSEDVPSSVTSESTNESSSSTSTSDDRDVKQGEEEVKGRRVKSVPPLCRGISRSTSRLPRIRQATDSVLASMILEKETFLKIELVDSGEAREDLRYWAEWKLSDRTKELAEGIWLSKSPKND